MPSATCLSRRRRLGPERLGGAYAWHSLLDAGAIVPAAPTRRLRGRSADRVLCGGGAAVAEGFADDDWHREQRVSRERGVQDVLAGARFAAFEEKEQGQHRAGKLADFTVLSADIMTIPGAGDPEVAQCDDDHRRRGCVRGAGRPGREVMPAEVLDAKSLFAGGFQVGRVRSRSPAPIILSMLKNRPISLVTKGAGPSIDQVTRWQRRRAGQ